MGRKDRLRRSLEQGIYLLLLNSSQNFEIFLTKFSHFSFIVNAMKLKNYRKQERK